MRYALLALALSGCAASPDCNRIDKSMEAAAARIGPCDTANVCVSPPADVDACVFGIDVALTCAKLQQAAMDCGLVR